EEELGGAGIRVGATGDGDRAAQVRQSVVRLAGNGRPRTFGLQLLGVEAALHQVAGYYPVQQGAVVEAVTHVLQEIGHALGGLVRVQLQRDIALGSVQLHLRSGRGGCRVSRRGLGGLCRQGQRQDQQYGREQ